MIHTMYFVTYPFYYSYAPQLQCVEALVLLMVWWSKGEPLKFFAQFEREWYAWSCGSSNIGSFVK